MVRKVLRCDVSEIRSPAAVLLRHVERAADELVQRFPTLTDHDLAVVLDDALAEIANRVDEIRPVRLPPKPPTPHSNGVVHNGEASESFLSPQD